MKLEIRESKIPGCFEIHPDVARDLRGVFVKTFHEDTFTEYGLATDFPEEYYSYSKKGVLRGFHFQLPPYEHIKIVYCVFGVIMDAIVDLRKGSPTHGNHDIFELSGASANMLYLEKGIAHAFYVLSDFAVVLYRVSTVYAPDYDCGILWNSAGVSWPDDMPILSECDKSFLLLSEFKSPFIYPNRNNE